MSIKRNNKQVAGNYVNINMNVFTEQYRQMLQELNSLYEATKQVVEGVSSPIGAEKIWRGEVIPSNYLEMNGQIISRADYSELYQWVVDNKLIITESDWVNNKQYGLYSYGDNTSTFRLPNMTGYYLVGYEPDHHKLIGSHQDDAMPNLTGIIDIAGTNDSSPVSTSKTSGVFKVNEKETTSYPITGSTTLTKGNVENIELDISSQVNISDRIQPRSIPVKYIVCAKDARVLVPDIDNSLTLGAG